MTHEQLRSIVWHETQPKWNRTRLMWLAFGLMVIAVGFAAYYAPVGCEGVR